MSGESQKGGKEGKERWAGTKSLAGICAFVRDCT